MTNPVPITPASVPANEHAVKDDGWQILATHNKLAILAALRGAGVSRVVVSFDGYGDEGQIEGICAYVDDEMADMPALQVAVHDIPWRLVDPATIHAMPCGLRDAIEQLAYDMLGNFEGGWQDNDGAFGEFILDVLEDSATLAFNARFTDSVYYEHEI